MAPKMPIEELPGSQTTETITSDAALIAPTGLSQTEASLVQTLFDINVRNEVETCMSSMLMDVETTFYLRRELQLQANQHAMNALSKQHKATILEADAERKARDSFQLELADSMVQEVMTISKELEDLIQWKKIHQHKVDEYDEIVARLAQTEEELVEAQRIQYSGQPKPRQPETLKETPVTQTTEPSDSNPPSETVTPPTAYSGEATPLAIDDDKPTAQTLIPDEKKIASLSDPSLEPSDKTSVENSPDAGDGMPPNEAQNTQDISEPESEAQTMVPAAAAVMLDEEDPDEEVPGLVEMDVEVLMTIFGFLDAMDILNMAQINISMYSKIDNIFGISEDGQTPPQPGNPPPSTPSQPTMAAAQVTTSTEATTQSSLPAEPRKAPPSAALGASTPSGAIGNRFFSMLQPARSSKGENKSGQPFNPSVAQSMASKLSDAELAAILSMTDKLNKLDKEVNLLRNEKEALSAKLDGTEAVKQFLINKVRDVETKLTQCRDDEIKVTQQIASDQEVIAFLDSRVQELERQTENLMTDNSRAQSELDSIKVQTSKKITMLSDMLKYEREKQKEEEGDWKATKKVLVKEVKSCRAQIMALQAERDGFKEQNEMLKRAIVTGKSSSHIASSPLR